MNKREKIREMLNSGKGVYLIDEIDDVAYDFTNYPRLRVKSKGGRIVTQNYTGSSSEFRAVESLKEISEKEFENY